MSHRLFFILLSVTFFVTSVPAWAEDRDAATGGHPHALSSQGPGFDAHTVIPRSPFTDLIGQPTITSMESALSSRHLRLKDLRPDSEMPTTNGLRVSTPLFNGQWTAESELARNHAASDVFIERDRASKSMMRFSLSTTDGPFRYGVSYRFADKQFYTVPDQELHEVWGEWGSGPLRVRSSVSEVFTNVESDPARPRSAYTGGRVTMAFTQATWPELSVTFARNLVETTPLQSGTTFQRNVADTVEGAISLTRTRWNARLASSYTLNASELQSGQETITYTHMLSSAFRPIEPLSITSIISYRTDVQQWTGVRMDTPVAALTVHYRHSAQLMISALGGYTGLHSSDGLTDNQSMNSRGIITWSPGGSSVTQVSLETGFTRTVLGGANGGGIVTQDLSGLVRVRLMQF